MGCICPSNPQQQGFVRTMATSRDMKQVYTLDKNILGKGSFGTVYKGINKVNPNLKIAIKAINKKELDK